MPPAVVTVLILAPEPDPQGGPLAAALDEARSALADAHARAFESAGATDVRMLREPRDGTPFGRRLARALAGIETTGLVVLGAGSIPLASADDLARFVRIAARDEPAALANNAYSADIVAVACAHEALRGLPDTLDTDNALPRWLREVRGVPVEDLRDRRDLAVDVDSPLDVLLLEGSATPVRPLALSDAVDASLVRARLASLRALAQDRSAELLVAGRVAADDLRRIERGTACRTRAVSEERGLRTASLAGARGAANRRPPRSLLAELLERDGVDRLGGLVARFADGALLDTRVLLAVRHGADERGWPPPEDRFASDLLLPEQVRDPWLRDLTASAASAPVPILLGGHTLVGPGAPLALGLPA